MKIGIKTIKLKSKGNTSLLEVNLPMSPQTHLSVGWSVGRSVCFGRLVCWSVIISCKGGKFYFHASIPTLINLYSYDMV